MKNEINPMVFWGIVGVVAVVVVVGLVLRNTGGFREQRSGSQGAIQQYQQTGQFYKPPAGAPVPGGAPGTSGAPGLPAMPGGALGAPMYAPPGGVVPGGTR
jgi:hypothetical protein